MLDKKILFILGTRPEAIKLYPLIKIFNKNTYFNIKVCNTAQHKDMVNQIIEFFRIHIDYNLGIMKFNQSLFHLTTAVLQKIEAVFNDFNPDLVIVQGDTTSAFTGSLAAYYNDVRIAHIEAGLRSFDKYAPFPEEINRVLTDHIVDYHFAPTQKAKGNLFNEGINENVWVVGNTVIDALLLGLRIIKKEGDKGYLEHFNFIDFSKKIILVTAHRRENFGERFCEICEALLTVAKEFDDVEIVYPVHMNPNINDPAQHLLRDVNNIHLIKPLPYQHLIWLMSKSYLILTDSGGIQEEAPSLGKPVLVLRDVTERPEGIEVGAAKLVGTKKERILVETSNLIRKKEEYDKMSRIVNPYGDGTAAQKIYNIIEKLFSK